MLTYTSQIVDLVNWVMLHVSKYLGIETCRVDFIPFKLTDDDALRNMLLEMVKEGQGAPSTLFEAFGMDFEKELEAKQRDTITQSIKDVETKFVVDQAVFLASKEIVDKFDKDNDYRSSLTKAQAIAQQLYQGDEMEVVQILNNLQVTDFPMFILVSRLLEEFQASQQTAAEPGMNDEQPQPGKPGGSGADNKGGDSKSSSKPTPDKKPTPKKED
jgi:hypothetical protein